MPQPPPEHTRLGLLNFLLGVDLFELPFPDQGRSTIFIDVEKGFGEPAIMSRIYGLLAHEIRAAIDDERHLQRPDIILVNGTKAIVAIHHLSEQLQQLGMRDITCRWMEKKTERGSGSEIRGFLKSHPQRMPIKSGQRVLIFFMVTSPNSNIRTLIDFIKRSGGIPVGIAVVFNRTELTSQSYGIPVVSIFSEPDLECVKSVLEQAVPGVPPIITELPSMQPVKVELSAKKKG